MESLLCDEVLMASPTRNRRFDGFGDSVFFTSKQDREEAISVCLRQEMSFMPRFGYIELLRAQDLVLERFRAIQWLIKSRNRLNLSFGTLFNAANYLDRFISMNRCSGSKWQYWMMELLSVACLSVASKFYDTSIPSLHEIQMEDLEHCFESSTIQRMELALLQALRWRLGSITPYSYVELLTLDLSSIKPHHRQELNNQITEQLLKALSDCQLLEFRPSVIAASALQLCLPSDSQFPSISRLIIPRDQKDNVIKCHKMMEGRSVRPLMYNFNRLCYYCPPSPVTVLVMERVEIYDCNVDLSLFMPSPININLKPSKHKRKRKDSYVGIE